MNIRLQQIRDRALITDMAIESKHHVNLPGRKCLPLRYRVAEDMVRVHGRAALAGMTWGQAKLIQQD